MSTLVYAQHDNSELKSATLSALACAQQLDETIDVLVVGHECASVADQAAAVAGVRKVLVADAEHLAHRLAENVTPVLENVAGGYDYVLAASTGAGKNVMPRLAAKLDVQQISDISQVVSGDTFVRPIYAGNAMATVRSSDAQKLITVRITSFDPVAAEGGSASIESVDTGADAGLSEFIGEEIHGGEGPELTTAKIVVSGGRGVGSAENFQLVERLAEKLGAAVGASRAAVDAGFVPNDYQVGQTGKVVAPDLYLAIGISGAIQHLAGMKESKVIAAINNDPEAPIFEVADYGLVADLFEAVPELDQQLG